MFRDIDARVTLTLTVAAMPSTAREKLPGLRVNDDWRTGVQWHLTRDDGSPVRQFKPLFVRELLRPRHTGQLTVGEQMSAVFRMPPLPTGTYRLTADMGDVRSEFSRFIVSDGTETVPLRTTYAWVQVQRARDMATREKWLRQLGALDPATPAPWIELGDGALSREDFAAAREYYNRALSAFEARRARFAEKAVPELLQEIDADRVLFANVVAAIDETAATGSHLVVRVQHDVGKRYVVAERASGRVIETIRSQ